MEAIYKTERLYIKKLGQEDITQEILNWFEDAELMKYYTNSKKKIDRISLEKAILNGEVEKNNFTYGIFYNDNDKIIGTLRLGPINVEHKISDLVVLIGDKEYHGKGLAVEAIKLGNKLAFDSYDLRKLFGGMFETNVSSIKAYTKAGWIVEGKLKGHYLENNLPVDRILVGCFNPKYFKKKD